MQIFKSHTFRGGEEGKRNFYQISLCGLNRRTPWEFSKIKLDRNGKSSKRLRLTWRVLWWDIKFRFVNEPILSQPCSLSIIGLSQRFKSIPFVRVQWTGPGVNRFRFKGKMESILRVKWIPCWGYNGLVPQVKRTCDCFTPLKQTGGYFGIKQTYGAPKRNTSIRPTKPPNLVQLLMAMFKYDLRSSAIPNEYTSKHNS